jgi:mono/diheme cytochrome c family protein
VKILFWMVVAAGVALTSSQNVAAQEAAPFFEQNCSVCHTIGGGRLVGPDLKDVTKQKNREWLEHFMQNPKAVIDSGDAYALQLRKDSNGMLMPTLPGLTPEMADKLVDLIEAESKLAVSRYVGAAAPAPAFTEEDLRVGTQIFSGDQRLGNGGPPCISCHTLGNLASLGGGRLGPDLTLVYDRLGGQRGVGAWLSAPPTPTMQSVFRGRPLRPEEIQALLAVFDDTPRKAKPAGTSSLVQFFSAGLAGTALGLVLMGWVWRGRFRSVRRALVSGAQRGAV